MILLLAKLLIARNPAMTLGYAKHIVKLGMIAVGVVLLIGAVWWIKSAEEADDQRNQDIGAAVQREADLTATLDKTEKANEAADTIKRSPDAARAECLQNARNPGDC